MSKRPLMIAVLCIFLITMMGCASPRVRTPSTSTALPRGTTVRALSHGGRDRSYILYTPSSVNWSQPIPLVFVFHGGTGNAESAMRVSGFNAIADQHGFLVVYPNGTSRVSDNRLLTWNGGACCGYAQRQNVDDVGFVRAIATELQSLTSIDSKRIYATGMSNGGILSYRLACEASDLVAAIAPVAGTLNVSPCNPSQPVSVIEFHGTADQHIPYDGGQGPKSLVNVDFTPVQDSVEFWTTFNACDDGRKTNSFADIQHETWMGCADATGVELYTIIGGGHAWPGGRRGWPGSDKPTKSISASQLIWQFFAVHPKP